MYQLHFHRGDADEFGRFIDSVASRVSETPDAKILVRLFNDTAQRDITDQAIAVLKSRLPQALYAGCSTSGNICDGAFVAGPTPNLSAVVDVFEDPSTQIEVHQLPLTRECRIETTEALHKIIVERPWVKAVEMLTTLLDVGMAEFCDGARDLPEDLIVFGGGALSTESINMWAGLPYVFSCDGRNSGASVVAVLYGGDNFHVEVQTIHGWKPLGRTMKITKANGAILSELDGIPAFERYNHYLGGEIDRFSDNYVVFPLAIDHEGRMIIKVLLNTDEQGAITLSSDLTPYHKECRIAYGDPGTILRSIRESANVIQAFEPQGIMAYSCAARFIYWGADNISRETLPLQGIAPTAGFYTGGEFCRTDGVLLHHNVTLLVAAMREGDARGIPKDDIEINETEFTRQMSIVHSLAAFVGVTSAELEDAYAQLKITAMTDGLTNTLNRREIESRIEASLDEARCSRGMCPPSLIMIDVDDFKDVNDEYGHKAGDDVLRSLGALMRSLVDEPGIGCSGRWGGEEFVALMPNTSVDEALVLGRKMREAFAAIDFAASGTHTISVGVTQARAGESADLLCQRVDKALYDAKRQGKNRVITQ